MVAQERAVRVFISSTFRDMHEEREELVKRVFPELRRRCEERGVAWGEVDLRWGVTDEEAAEGAVLPICLAEIEQTRPYFVGLLGERYGWVPDEIAEDLRTELPWLADSAGRSVTELEILHGVLNDPAMEQRAFFYLRDPGYIDTLPPAEQQIHRERPSDDEIERLGPDAAETAAQHRRDLLGALKDRLRHTELPVRDGYADPIALGQMVLDDLGAMIDRLFPADLVEDPADRDDADHASFVTGRAAGYVGADTRLPALDTAVSNHPVVLVTGDPGAGKSALLASWVAQRRRQGDEVVAHFVGATTESSDGRAMLHRLIRLLQPGGVAVAGDDPQMLAAVFAETLRHRATERPVVLVLDGLDLLDDRDHAPDLAWFPWEIPTGVTVVASAAGARTREAAEVRGFQIHHVQPLDDDERRRLVVEFLAGYSKRLAPDLVERVVEGDLTGNPRYLRAVLDELRQHGDHFTLSALLDTYLGLDTIDDLFEAILARWEHDYERDRAGLVADAFTLIAGSRTGLSEPELLGLLGGGEPGRLPHAVWAPLYLAAGEALMRRSGRLTVAHDHFAKAIDDRYLADDDARRRVHLRLADAFAADPTPRSLVELPWQLRHAEEWDRLSSVLADPERLPTLYRTDLAEIRTGWATLERVAGRRMVDTYRFVVDDPAAHAEIAWEVARLLTDAGYGTEAMTLHRYLVEAARIAGDEPRLFGAVGNLAAAHLERGELDAAGVALDEQEEIARRTGDERWLQMVLGNRAVLLRKRGDLVGALEIHAAEEELCRRLGDLSGLQASLGNQGAIRRDQRDFDAALKRFDEQEQVARQIGDGTLINKALVNRAQVLADRGSIAEALALMLRQETECRTHGDLAALTANLVNRSAILVEQGAIDEAQPLVDEAEGLARRLGNDEALTRVLFQRALIAQRLGDRPAALTALDEHATVAADLGDRSPLAAGLGMRGTLMREAGDLEAALGLHIEEEHLYRQIPDTTGVATSLGNQALVRHAQGDVAAAVLLLAEQERLVRPLGLPAMLQVILGNKAAFLMATGDLEGAEEALTEQESLCRLLEHRHGLASCLGNQGLLAHRRGDLDGATAKHRQQEALCREARGSVRSCHQSGQPGGGADRPRRRAGGGAAARRSARRRHRRSGSDRRRPESGGADADTTGAGRSGRIAACGGDRRDDRPGPGRPVPALPGARHPGDDGDGSADRRRDPRRGRDHRPIIGKSPCVAARRRQPGSAADPDR